MHITERANRVSVDPTVVVGAIALLGLPAAIYLLLKVALRDPRDPAAEISPMTMSLSVGGGTAPILFSPNPASAVYNVSLVFALSLVLTPLLFGQMKTDSGLESLRDKILIMLTRTAFAAAMAIPLTLATSYWFIILAAVAFVSFSTRKPMWLLSGGYGPDYSTAQRASVFIFFIYWMLVTRSTITAETWFDWNAFLVRDFPK